MNAIFRTIILIGIITAILGVIGTMTPTSLSTPINNSIIYFLSYLNYLNPFLPVDVLYSAMNFFFIYLMGLITFIIGIFIIRIF
jgi:hypothetical protein